METDGVMGRAGTEPSRSLEFHNYGEDPYYGLLLSGCMAPQLLKMQGRHQTAELTNHQARLCPAGIKSL